MVQAWHDCQPQDAQRDIPESLRLLQRSHFAVCAVTGSNSIRIGVVAIVVVVVVVVVACGGVLEVLLLVLSFAFSVPLVDTVRSCPEEGGLCRVELSCAIPSWLDGKVESGEGAAEERHPDRFRMYSSCMGTVVGGWMGLGSCNVAGYGYSCPDLPEPEPDPGPVMKGDKVPGLMCPEEA